MQPFSYNSQTLGYVVGMPAGRPSKRQRSPFGDRLTTTRERAGLTQQQLADKLGTIQRVISYWEREPVDLRADHLSALADALNVSTDFLLGRQEAIKQRNGGPVGKAKKLFEAISRLPRHQQEKVFSILEPFVKEHVNGHKQAA